MVRVAAEADIPSILELKGTPSTVPEVREHLARLLLSPRRLYLVAVSQGQVIGWAKACWVRAPAQPLAEDAPEGWYLMGSHVREPWRRQGVATALSRARLRWLRARSVEAVFACTRADNLPIHATLKKLGFTEVTRQFNAPLGVELGDDEGILWALPLS